MLLEAESILLVLMCIYKDILYNYTMLLIFIISVSHFSRFSLHDCGVLYARAAFSFVERLEPQPKSRQWLAVVGLQQIATRTDREAS